MPPGQAPKHENKIDTTTIVVIIVLLVIISVFSFSSGNFKDFLQRVSDYLNQTLHLAQVGHIIMIVLYVVATFFIFIICYTSVRMFEIRKKERKHLKKEIEEYAHHQAEKDKKAQEGGVKIKNERWNQVITFIFSQNPNDWKLAVIEADAMLDTLMDQLGFKGENLGENLGEKLKTADRDKFHSLSSAWEVHVVRNRIAHEGSQFSLSQYEAKRIIALYEQIFREFDFI
jgi:membrane protein implicated in regulation of membrane protease activity